MQFFPVSLKLVLLEKVEAYLILQFNSGFFEGLRISHLKTFFPVLPALALFSLLDRHVQCVIFQPVRLLFKERSVFLHLGGSAVMQSSADTLLKPLVGLSEQRIAVLVHSAVIHFLLIRAEPDGLALLP